MFGCPAFGTPSPVGMLHGMPSRCRWYAPLSRSALRERAAAAAFAWVSALVHCVGCPDAADASTAGVGYDTAVAVAATAAGAVDGQLRQRSCTSNCGGAPAALVYQSFGEAQLPDQHLRCDSTMRQWQDLI